MTLEKPDVRAERTEGDATSGKPAGTTNPPADPKVSLGFGLKLALLPATGVRTSTSRRALG